jgi:hypothetical protein
MAAASAAASCSAAVSVTTWRCSNSRENEAYSAARSGSSSSSSNSSVRMQAYSNNSIISSRSNSSSGSSSIISPMVVGREAGFEEGDLERPRWAGDDVLSRFVTALIAIKPLFNIMKFGARQVVIRTAEKKGINWSKMADEVLTSDVYAEKELLEDKSLVYPDYYLKEFHAYADGNLSWKVCISYLLISYISWALV